MIYSGKKLVSLFVLLARVAVNASSNLVIFGDQTSDIGNNLTYSFDFPTWYGRPSNGPIWNEYAVYYNGYTLLNFALPGSIANITNFLANDSNNIQYTDAFNQINNFKSAFGNDYNSTMLKNDIAVIQLGFNDLYMSILPYASSTVNSTFVDIVSLGIMTFVDQVYSLGYRNLVLTDIQDLSKMPDAQRFSTQNIQNFSNYVNAVNLKTKLYALEYIKSKGSDMQSFKIVSLYDFYNAVTSQDVATALNLTLSTDSCYPVVPTAVIRQACLDSDKLAYFGATTLNTKLHALLGAAFTEAMTTNNLFISGTSLASIAQKYNVTGAGTTTNFLYGNTTAQTGTLNINEYNSTGIQENGAVLLSNENNGDIGVFDIGVNSVVTISSSSSQLYYSFTLYFSITLLALSLLGDLN